MESLLTPAELCVLGMTTSFHLCTPSGSSLERCSEGQTVFYSVLGALLGYGGLSPILHRKTEA